jgi:hypothetical protein
MLSALIGNRAKYCRKLCFPRLWFQLSSRSFSAILYAPDKVPAPTAGTDIAFRFGHHHMNMAIECQISSFPVDDRMQSIAPRSITRSQAVAAQASTYSTPRELDCSLLKGAIFGQAAYARKYSTVEIRRIKGLEPRFMTMKYRKIRSDRLSFRQRLL